ncbi:DUF1134 domain-containing protein [Orrella marina]|uniref:DUF1134 domain-containing protein n=1 Tax=Orrella marina TaxID=2163011 RepID=A0A2R4XJ44_9BURK|nr:DUF1134 domain-containing protein [Orrella marina]AWB33820.1 DUF1134 domain-containing protein [Orrella marina]
MKMAPILSAGLIASAMAFSSAAIAEQKKQPVAQVSIEETQFGLIIGGSVGGGKLTYEGKEYPFQLGGLSLGANIGVSKMAAVGEVFDMKRVEDFPGTYVKLDGNIALGGGVGGMTLKNENGVIMNLKGTTQGLQFNIGASGVTVYFDKK